LYQLKTDCHETLNCPFKEITFMHFHIDEMLLPGEE